MGKKKQTRNPNKSFADLSPSLCHGWGDGGSVCARASRPEMFQECQATWGGRFRVGKLGCDANFWVTLRKLAKRCPSWPGQQLQFPLAEAEIQGSFVLHFFTFSQT